tara:strand:- start:2692 stop:2847 length:156 start_codon:yes stop_codon:yes gene_type:complete
VFNKQRIVHNLVQSAFKRAVELLIKQCERLVLGADLLLQKETLDEQALKNL